MPSDSSRTSFPDGEDESLRTEVASLRARLQRADAQFAAMRESLAECRHLHHARIDGFLRMGMDGRIEEVNDLFCRMVGYSEEELLSLTHRDITPARWHTLEDAIIRNEVVASGKPERYEKEYRRKDGTVFPAEVRVFLVPGRQGEPPLGVAAVARDITERKAAEAASKRSEERFRDMSLRLMTAQEAERSRLARELHDDFSQRLALLAVNLHLVRQTMPAEATALRESLSDLYRQVQALARDLRRTSHNLHPARLEQLGLVSAIRGLCEELSMPGLAIAFDAKDVARDLPETLALCFYRVAQEALQNVVKHSGASAASVELLAEEGQLRLMVTDNGKGFDVGAAQRKDALGLASIRERVYAIDGRFLVDSEPGRGTRLEVRAPVQAPASGN